ncbi:MAG: hypothetical protein ABI895_24400 [Deltaproteobacteria bacterium]
MQRQAMLGRLDAVRRALSSWRSCSWLPWLYRAALIGLVACVWQHCLRAVWPFTIDDAGISYAYAKHLAEGRGPVAVVGGPWVEGYSNPLWVFLLVPFQWLGFELPVVAKLLGVLALASAALFGAGALAAAGGERWSGWGSLQALLALALGCSLEIVVWAVAGLENSLFWALLLGLAYLDSRESRDPNARGLSGLLAFGICITRPEGPLYVAPWLALQLLQVLRQPGDRRRAARAVLLCIGPLVLYHALHYLTFGDWVPNTFHAKSSRWKWADGYGYLALYARESRLPLLLPLVALGLARPSRLVLLLAWDCVAGVAFVLYAGGDWMPHGRFLSLFLPAALVLAAAGVDNLRRGLVWAAGQRVPRELMCLALGAGLAWFWWAEQAPRLARLARRPWCHFCERLAVTQAVQRLSRKAGLAHTTLLTQDFGGPSWLSSAEFQPIDFLGLCDRNVALLRQDMVAHRGHLRNDFRFYQYLFHEQPQPPSWLNLPPNFWPDLDRSPEYRLDYFRMAWALLPHTRGPYFALHRGELVDYFPPVPRAEFRPLASSLVLIGARSFAAPSESRVVSVAPGVQVTTLVSVAARSRLSGEEQLELRIEGGGEQVRSEPVLLSRGLNDIPQQLGRGEPLSVEFTFELPRAPASAYAVHLGVSQRAKVRAGAEPIWLELEPLRTGTPLAADEHPLPRYPAALPPPIEPELRALRPAVTRATEQRRRPELSAAADAALVRQLLALGAGYEARALTGQAYLADVWATQLDPRAWERVGDAIFRLRQTALDDEHSLTIALLQRYYASGTPEALAALVGFYLSVQRLDEARYFAAFRPPSGGDAELWSRLDRALASLTRAAAAPAAAEALALVARDPFGGAFDFEQPGLEGWEGDTAAYRAGAQSNDRDLTGLRGQHGQGVLSSLGPDDGARGSLLSPAFVLQGRMLSVLIGGGSRKQGAGIELMVDDAVVQSAFGIESDIMFPALWDVSEYQGKSARLRVFDRSKDAHVLVDRVLLWN